MKANAGSALHAIASAIAVLLCAEAAFAAEPPASGRWKIERGMSEGEPGSPRLARLRKTPWYFFIEHGLPEGKLVEILLANRDKRVVSHDEQGNVYSYYLKDLEWEREVALWRSEGCREYLLPAPIGAFQAEGKPDGELLPAGGVRSFGSTRIAVQALLLPPDSPCFVRVYLGVAGARGKDPLHGLVGWFYVPKEGRALRRPGGLVLEGSDVGTPGHSYIWVSGQNAVVISSRVPAEDVVDAYLAKYPSSLPEDFQVDRVKWAQEEIAWLWAAMESGIGEPNQRLNNRVHGWFDSDSRALSALLGQAEAIYEYDRKEKSLYETQIAGEEWRQDYEMYRKELIALRREAMSKLEGLVERAKTDLTYDAKRRRFVVGEGKPADVAAGRPPEAAPGVEPSGLRAPPALLIAIGLAAFLALAGAVVLIRRRGRRA